MNPTRRRRLLWVLALIAAAGLAATLVTLALQRNIAYLYTPSEVAGGDAGARVASGETRFRLGGMVARGSFHRPEGSLESSFRVTDGDAEMTVRYTGILPDLFREDQAVVATGRMQGDTFVAEEILAKHDETYMPKEVADKMGKAHRKHDVDDSGVNAAPSPAGAGADAQDAR